MRAWFVVPAEATPDAEGMYNVLAFGTERRALEFAEEMGGDAFVCLYESDDPTLGVDAKTQADLDGPGLALQMRVPT